MKTKILLLGVILLAVGGSLFAAPNITVSGNSVTILGSAQTISLTCTLIDPNNTGNLHSGANIITVFVTNTTTPGNVATCGPIYGNDVITDAFGNANTTYYKVQVFTVSGGIVASTPSLQAFYAFTGSGTVDLSTATPLAPSFMSGANGNVVVPGNFTVNGTFAPTTLTVSGTGTFTGRMNCKNFENVQCVDDTNTGGQTGSDICAWIGNAQSNLASTGGVVNVYLANGAFAACSTGDGFGGTFAVGSTTQGVTVNILGAGEIDVQNTVIVSQGSKLVGQNGGSGSSGTTPTVIGAGASFPTSGAYLVQMGPLSVGTADGPSVRDLMLNCKNVALSKGINISNMQDVGDVTDVFVLHCVGNGIDVTGSGENTRIVNTIVSSSSSATADNCLTVGAIADHMVLYNFGCTSSAASPSTGAAIQCNGCNIHVSGMHAENHTDGVLLNGSGTNRGAVVLTEVDGLINLTNTVHVASNWNGTLEALGIRKFTGTNAIKNDLAAFNHVCTDEVVGKYLLGANVGQTGNVSLDTDCTTLPSIRSATFAVSGGSAGNFTPDATVLLDLRSPNTFSAIRMDDTTDSQSMLAGPGVGGNFLFAIRDRNNGGKQILQTATGATGGTITLPTACTTTTVQPVGSPPVLCGITSQKTESAADANVLTFTPPAAAGSYRIRLTGSISAANTATLGWTATWTDSNGNAATPTNLPVCIASAGTCAATTGALSAVDRFSGEFQIDVNNAATAIVIKLTFSGTSFTAKVSATVERII